MRSLPRKSSYKPRNKPRNSKRKSTRKSTRKTTRKTTRKSSGGKFQIPSGVQKNAQRALQLKALGFAGGTETGHKRARQLARGGTISSHDAMVMRAWFARHAYTSLPGYKKWVSAGKPVNDSYFKRHGSVYAWLSWGGDSARKWVN